MKKQLQLSLVSAAVLLAATTVCSAGSYKGENYKGEAPCPTPLMIKDGWYLGAQLGGDSYRVNHNASVINATGSLTASPVINPTGVVGGLFGGYGQYFSDIYYLGGELFANASNASSKYSVATTASGSAFPASYYAKVSIQGSYGFGLLPGLKLNDASLLYLRLGYNRVSIKGQETATIGGVSSSNSKTNWSSGFNLGLGLETAFYQNWSLRAEASHTNYSSFYSGATKIIPYDNQAMLGLIYHFA